MSPPVPSATGPPSAPPTADTAQALMAAARELFARRGYDGTSVRSITRAAGANLGAVTYHFGSKRALYDQMLESVVAPLAHRVDGIASGPVPAPARISRIIEAFFDHLRLNPDMPHLLLQEIAAGKGPPAAVASLMRRTLVALTDLIRDAQRSRQVRDGDPLFLALSLVSQPVYLSLVRPLARELAGRDLDDPDARRALIEHALRFAWQGLSPTVPGTQPREESRSHA